MDLAKPSRFALMAVVCQSGQGKSTASIHQRSIWPRNRPPCSKEPQDVYDLLHFQSSEKGARQRHWWAGAEVGGCCNGLCSSPARQVMSNGANINVSVLLSVVKSLFAAMHFIFSLPALWMLSADMSGWYPLPKICTLSTFLRSYFIPPTTPWHTHVKFLPGSVRHKTVHTYQIMSLTFQGQQLSIWVRHRVDWQAWFGVGAKGGSAFLSFFAVLFFKIIKPSRNRWCVAQSTISIIVTVK